MSAHSRHDWLWLFLGLSCALPGCGSSSTADPRTLAWREKLLLEAEPAAAVSLVEAQDLAKATARVPIVVMGKIGGTELDPFEAGKAIFLLTELDSHGHAPGEADNCPFCKRRADKAPMAIVEFVDERRQTLPVDARDLLGVAKGQVVTIVGEAQLNSLGKLVITARGVYLADRPSTADD